MFTASIVIPCYNEESTLRASVERVLAIADDSLALEIIIVDDCSSDRSREIAAQLQAEYPAVHVELHERNSGKGAALRTGFRKATGDVVAVHDADLEYDPQDLKGLIALIRDDKADVVFGSRFLTAGAHRVLYFWHSLGNRFLTFLSNMFTDLNLTDMETCYKVFRRELIQNMEIYEERFGFEPEIVAKLSEQRVRIYEIGITYAGRTYDEGKKIGVTDGFRALYCILHYNAWRAPLPLQLAAYLVMSFIIGTISWLTFWEVLPVSLLGSVAGFTFYTVGNSLGARYLIFGAKRRWSDSVETLWLIISFLLAYGVFSYFSGQAPLYVGKVFGCVPLGLAAASLFYYATFRYWIFSRRKT